LEQASQMALAEIQQVPFDSQHWGVVHADLHAGNFLIGPAAAGSARDWEIIPIDFSFCGFGHYFFDLSVCLSGGLNDALRTSFLKGYRSIRTLAEESMRSVDAFALAGRLSYYAYQIDNPSEQSWLRRRIPEVVQKECTRFLQGRPVIADE
jgi:Ser/Thr protein kinase RdoA (MazF antagonist)